MISDGYGDRLTLDEIDEIIASKEHLLWVQAAERGVNPNDWGDVINEGRIAAWEVLQKRPDAPAAYVHAAMGKRMTEVLTRGVWFGMEGHRGKAIDPIRRVDRDSFDDPDFKWDPVADDVMDSILMAYHDGEINQALDMLPPRWKEYVVLRFWMGWTNPEIARLHGVNQGNVERTWRQAIRPRLAEMLERLAA